MDPEKIREDFPILKRRINGKELVFLANASTTQKPKQVLNVMNEYYEEHNANPSTSNRLSTESKRIFEKSREKIADFIHADTDEIIFTKNATEAINLVAYAYKMKKKDEVITTAMEHHSNIVPWQMLEKEKKIRLRFLGLTENSLDLDELDSLMGKHTKLLAACHVSNVLGRENPVRQMAKIAHENDTLILVDAVQSVARMPINVKEIGCDFMAFSGHKMLGPQGIGCLYVKKGIMKELRPFVCGSVMKKVSKTSCEFLEGPERFEPGMQNIAGAIGFAAAIDYLDHIGMKNVQYHNEMLTDYALKHMKDIDGVKIYGAGHGIASFNVKQMQSYDVSGLMGDESIIISAGNHNCIPLMDYLDTNGVARMSTYIYNTKEDIDKFIERLKRVASLGTKRLLTKT